MKLHKMNLGEDTEHKTIYYTEEDDGKQEQKKNRLFFAFVDLQIRYQKN